MGFIKAIYIHMALAELGSVMGKSCVHALPSLLKTAGVCIVKASMMSGNATLVGCVETKNTNPQRLATHPTHN